MSKVKKYAATVVGLIGLFSVVGCAQVPVKAKFETDGVFTLAFASCAQETVAQPIWHEIAKVNPEVFLFIGDNVYADVYEVNGKRTMQAVTSKARFVEAYDQANAIPEFAAFRAQVPVMLGTWDDHDYGVNDGGKEFAMKKESQEAFLDFFEFAKNDPIRQQEGIYHSRMFEDEGRQVQIIMLDTRYHRDAMLKNPSGRPKNRGPYIPIDDHSASILGNQQWQWLAGELEKKADVRFIVTSIQMVAYEHSWEGWGMFPHERAKMYQLISDKKANGIVFISGDRHLMEISKDEGQLGHKVPYPIWDFTSSDIIRTFSEVDENNAFRQGAVVRDTNFGEVIVKWSDYTLDSQIVLTAKDRNGDILNQQTVLLRDLQL
jgi:alkaline phosphatase D